MTTTILPGTEVAEFASAVRAALSDLPPDELDELTDGLEADLSERLDEASEAAAGLGDPLAYAEELRAAAGYPPRTARSHLGAALPSLRTLPQELRRRWYALLAGHSLIASAVGFLVALRPVWWVFRGAAAYMLLAGFLGISGTVNWPIGVAFVVLSVQLGRGRMLRRTWVRWTTRAVSAIVIVASPFLLGWVATGVTNAMYPVYSDPEVWYPQQLTVDGMPVFNVFAYDAEGNPIDRVQLFDQDGNPLDLVDQSNPYISDRDGDLLVPNDDVPGRPGWNVFPLGSVDAGALDEFGGLTNVTPSIPDPPFPAVKALSGHDQPEDDQSLPMTEEGGPLAGQTADPMP